MVGTQVLQFFVFLLQFFGLLNINRKVYAKAICHWMLDLVSIGRVIHKSNVFSMLQIEGIT